MKKKEYRDVTYGMRYKEFSKILSRKMRLVTKCKKYEDFRADINLLRKTRSNCGKISLVANHWMRTICNMSKSELIKLVDNYEKGTFDPYQFAPKQEQLDEDYDQEDEEERV